MIINSYIYNYFIIIYLFVQVTKFRTNTKNVRSFDPICSSFSVLTSCKIADHPQIFIHWESRILGKTQEKEKKKTAVLLWESSSWRDGGGGGSPFRGTRKREAVERPCDGAGVTAASAVEILQASVVVPAHTCRASLDFPVSLQSPDNTFLLYAGDSFMFSHPPSVSANNLLFFPLLRSFLRALGKPETSGP